MSNWLNYCYIVLVVEWYCCDIVNSFNRKTTIRSWENKKKQWAQRSKCGVLRWRLRRYLAAEQGSRKINKRSGSRHKRWNENSTNGPLTLHTSHLTITPCDIYATTKNAFFQNVGKVDLSFCATAHLCICFLENWAAVTSRKKQWMTRNSRKSNQPTTITYFCHYRHGDK
jgi:hypothetical protein